VPTKVSQRVRSRVFGRDPEGFDRARLAYPPRVYEILTDRCGLRRGAAVFEIGPGTGIATRELLRRGADPMTLIEPDRRLARYLMASIRTRGGRVRITIDRFERAALLSEEFDLGVAASSFHWLSERSALRRVGRVLRHKGWWASWNNHHGDPFRASRFHDALHPLYRDLAGKRGITYRGGEAKAGATRDRKNRIRALESVGIFDHISREDVRWTVTLGSDRVRALWATFSDIMILSPRRREWFLAELERVAEEQFGGKVTFPMLTPVYTARRV
jgi:SAM-dependent methyltransferase